MTNKPYNGGAWTEARFHSFIKSALRTASMKWPPKYEVKKDARVSRGQYRCVGYNIPAHIIPASLPPKPGNKRRINNAMVDHIHPVIDPVLGFISWDDVIKRMFVEKAGLQLLCHECHSAKTKDERDRRKNG